MKKALRSALIYILCFLIVFHILDRMTFNEASTSSTWKYIQGKDPEPIDILFMGNSHVFCDVNPSIINQCMDLNTMILGGSQQPIDQTYENLKILLHYVHPKVIVLEANALAISTDWVFNEGKEGNLYPNFDSIRNPIYRLGAIVHTIKRYWRWPEAYSQLFRPTSTWTRFHSHEEEMKNQDRRINHLLGYNPRHNILDTGSPAAQATGNTTEEDIAAAAARSMAAVAVGSSAAETAAVGNAAVGSSAAETTAADRPDPAFVEKVLIAMREMNLPLNEPDATRAFEGFLDLAAKEGIPVYIFKSPTLNTVTSMPKAAGILAEMAEADPRIAGYINYSEQMTRIGIETDDFSDLSHLNREGANKFTLVLMEWLSEQLGLPYDLSKATGIRQESFYELPDGNYRYSVSLFDNTQIKFIVKDRRGNVASETEYSDVSFIDMPRISRANKLYYRIRAKKEIPGRSYPFEKTEYKFMHDLGK